MSAESAQGSSKDKLNRFPMATIFSAVESNSINFINKSERSGDARSLFWPWAAANVSFLALSYGSFFLGFGISFWQATVTDFKGGDKYIEDGNLLATNSKIDKDLIALLA